MAERRDEIVFRAARRLRLAALCLQPTDAKRREHTQGKDHHHGDRGVPHRAPDRAERGVAIQRHAGAPPGEGRADDCAQDMAALEIGAIPIPDLARGYGERTFPNLPAEEIFRLIGARDDKSASIEDDRAGLDETRMADERLERGGGKRRSQAVRNPPAAHDRRGDSNEIVTGDLTSEQVSVDRLCSLETATNFVRTSMRYVVRTG
jgi:hypothetical protein